jgi:hypothetical protein
MKCRECLLLQYVMHANVGMFEDLIDEIVNGDVNVNVTPWFVNVIAVSHQFLKQKESNSLKSMSCLLKYCWEPH